MRRRAEGFPPYLLAPSRARQKPRDAPTVRRASSVTSRLRCRTTRAILFKDMNYKISKRAASLTPSLTLAIDSKAKQMKADGLDVVGFGAGEPDFDTPQHIKDACAKALAAGFTKSPNCARPSLTSISARTASLTSPRKSSSRAAGSIPASTSFSPPAKRATKSLSRRLTG